MEDIKSLVTRFYDTWNAHDRDGWLACCDENITFNAPGGIAGQGLDTGRMFWSLWQDAFPDCRCTINVAVAEGNEAVQESAFTGTHTETFHVPNSQDIPATGKSVALPYTLGLTYLNGKWSSFRLIFDRVELMTQLGLMRPRAGLYLSMRPSAACRRARVPKAWAGIGAPVTCPNGGATADSHGLSQATCQQPGRPQ